MLSPTHIDLVSGTLLNAAGILGHGLICLAAVRMAICDRSRGGFTLAFGACAGLLARLYVATSPHWVTNDLLYWIGPLGIGLLIILPPLLLTLGLSCIVWGLWGHERWRHEMGS